MPVKHFLQQHALCGLFLQNRMVGACQLGYLLPGSGHATFAPAKCTPGKTTQPDVGNPSLPLAPAVSLDNHLVARRGGERGACVGITTRRLFP